MRLGTIRISATRGSLEQRLSDEASSLLAARVLNMADEIADDIDMLDIVVGDFYASEFILDRDHQFESVEPIGPEIVSEVRFIRDKFEIHAKMLGNESADIVGGKDFSQSRYWLTRSQATDGHDKAPRFVQLFPYPIRQSAPECGAGLRSPWTVAKASLFRSLLADLNGRN
jgi:hypothetical protein